MGIAVEPAPGGGYPRPGLATTRRYVGVGLLLAGLIALSLWPWPRFFLSGLPQHWDPPLHAWKLIWNAEQILHGALLRPTADANVFYPFANTLYFDDLFWVPSLVTWWVYAITGNGLLLYNATLLLFWALSGLCMYAFLEELGLGGPACLFGAVAFCLMPYRTSYYVEFNMQLLFGVPLCLLFLTRLIARPGPWPALGLALSFWAQAVSALYYAIILVFCLPLVAVGLLASHPARLRDRRLVAWTGLAALVALGLGLAYLGPYLELNQIGGFARTPNEAARHALQPLAYLVDAHGPATGRALGVLPTRLGEMTVFPGFSVLALAAVYAFGRRGSLGPETSRPRFDAWLRRARWTALAMAGLAAGAASLAHATSRAPAAGAVFESALWIACGTSVVLAALPRRTARSSVMQSLGAAAIFCVLLSLGPRITVGEGIVLTDNHLYALVYDNLPFLQATRVVSRFSIVALLFLTAASAGGVHLLASRLTRMRGAVALSVLLVALVIAESRMGTYAYRHYDVPPSSGTFSLLARMPRHTLAMIPMGERDCDSLDMLYTAALPHYLFNGWSGFIPGLQQIIGAGLRWEGQTAALARLEEVWPDPLILVDRAALAREATLGDYRFAESDLMPCCDRIATDDRYALYRPKSRPRPLRAYRRRIRRDILVEDHVVSFYARAAAGTPGDLRLEIACNGRPVEAIALGADWRRFTVPIPRNLAGRLEGDTLSIAPIRGRRVESASWELVDFQLRPGGSGA